jgi:hypothetical protein
MNEESDRADRAAEGLELQHRDVGLLIQSVNNLTRTMEQLRRDIADTYVRKDVHDQEITSIRREIKVVADDVEEHDGWLLWALRLAVGTVILALLTVVLVQANGGGVV